MTPERDTSERDTAARDAAARDAAARGTLERIWIKRAKRGPMDARPSASLRANLGLVGNANQGGRRQVTILDADRWNAIAHALGTDVDPSVRRANLLVRGVDLTASRGRVLRVGNVRIQIAGETKPCYQMDEALPGLQTAMRPDWGGGAFGIVLDDGDIATGDAVTWDAADPEMHRRLFDKRAE